MSKILLVEDDQNINKMEKILLEKNNYEVVSAYSGTEAMLWLERDSFEIIILDLMLPGMDGEEVLCQITKGYSTPVICVSAKDALDTRVECMRKGADDFIIKPFHNEELLVRIETVLRRYNKGNSNGQENVLKYKNLSIDLDNHSVYVDDNEIFLTAKEFLILELLMTNPRKVFSKRNIYESVWSDEVFVDDSAVTVHVSNLRNKLSEDKETYIKTVWGIGYKMQDN